jgi:glutaredoxin
MKHLTLYSKPGCHLCEIVEQILTGLRREFEFTLDRVDISADPNLMQKYGALIPVVVVDEKKVLTAPIHVADLYAALGGRHPGFPRLGQIRR